MDRAEIQRYIDDAVEESLTLDYKAAAALRRSDGKKTEITKDVSAFANSAGGRLIYGVKEYDDLERRHLPERIDPVSRSEFSKEWLEQVIGGIRPRVLGITIEAVPLASGSTDVVYVVDVPQSHTAHQALDLKYYRRFNFESVPMYDHEIRDVINRSAGPTLRAQLSFSYALTKPSRPQHSTCRLDVRLVNESDTLAEYWILLLAVDANLEPAPSMDPLAPQPAQKTVVTDNAVRRYDVYESQRHPSRDVPIWSGLSKHVMSVEVEMPLFPQDANFAIGWLISAPRMKNVARGVVIDRQGKKLQDFDAESLEDLLRQMTVFQL